MCTAGFACLISTVNGRIQKKERRRSLPWKTGASSRHITNLKQSIFVNIYVLYAGDKHSGLFWHSSSDDEKKINEIFGSLDLMKKMFENENERTDGHIWRHNDLN